MCNSSKSVAVLYAFPHLNHPVLRVVCRYHHIHNEIRYPTNCTYLLAGIGLCFLLDTVSYVGVRLTDIDTTSLNSELESTVAAWGVFEVLTTTDGTTYDLSAIGDDTIYEFPQRSITSRFCKGGP